MARSLKETVMVRRGAAVRVVAVLVAALTVLTCATNPVTGRRELALISESQEIQMGRQYSNEVIGSIGLVPDSALQRYVRAIGMNLAARSERPNLPWEFHVLDDAAVNAFALPGGFIFVTRGLLSHMVNEAELATVLGHENGHVTARHSVQQLSRSQLAQLGLGVGMVLSSTVAEFGDIAGAGLGLMFLKFGRDDELQADELGFRYSLTGGYDAREMVKVFEMLARQGAMAGAGRLPEWQSTHPDPGNRIRAIEQRIAASAEDFASKRVGSAEFLARIDGMVFGENPRHGYFENELFLHPDLEFRLQFPPGWRTQNQPQAVMGVSGDGSAAVELRLAEGTHSVAAERFFGQQGVQRGVVINTTVNGLRAVRGEFTATSDGATFRGIASFIEHGGRTYRVLSYTAAPRFSGWLSVFDATHRSFARVTDQRVLGVQPMRLKVERVPRSMTVREFHEAFPSQVSLEVVALINGLTAESGVSDGTMLKRVVR